MTCGERRGVTCGEKRGVTCGEKRGVTSGENGCVRDSCHSEKKRHPVRDGKNAKCNRTGEWRLVGAKTHRLQKTCLVGTGAVRVLFVVACVVSSVGVLSRSIPHHRMRLPHQLGCCESAQSPERQKWPLLAGSALKICFCASATVSTESPICQII